MQQLLDSLLQSSVQPTSPFQNTRVDYAGPFNMRIIKGRSNKLFKMYVAIFVRMCTKTVHLEAVSDMTTEAFIAALKRFISRRGICGNIFSDCESNFVGADRELQQLIKTTTLNDQISTHMTAQGIK